MTPIFDAIDRVPSDTFLIVLAGLLIGLGLITRIAAPRITR